MKIEEAERILQDLKCYESISITDLKLALIVLLEDLISRVELENKIARLTKRKR